MALFPHIALGFVTKRVRPNIHVGWLILASEFIEIISFITGFIYMGFYHMTYDDAMLKSVPWSHSLGMAFIWMFITILISWWISHDRSTCLIIALLVFGHWIIDFISWPMVGKYIPLWLGDSLSIGFYIGIDFTSNLILGAILDFLWLPVGIIVYLFTIKKLKITKKQE